MVILIAARTHALLLWGFMRILEMVLKENSLCKLIVNHRIV